MRRTLTCHFTIRVSLCRDITFDWAFSNLTNESIFCSPLKCVTSIVPWMCHVCCSLECVTSFVPLNVSHLSLPWMCHVFRSLECVTSFVPVECVMSFISAECVTDRQTDRHTYEEIQRDIRKLTHRYTYVIAYVHTHTYVHARTHTHWPTPTPPPPTPPTKRVWNREPTHTPCNKEVVTHQDNKQKTASQWKFWGGNRPEKRP